MYLTYFKREFAKKHGNSGVLASFILFLSGIKRRLRGGFDWDFYRLKGGAK